VVPDGDPELVTPEEFRATLESDPADTLVVGDWRSLPDKLWTGLHRVRRGRPRYPSADVILEIAAIGAGREEFQRAEEVRPRYLREPDAAINWQQFRSEGMWPT
jgi:tRNA A37 threonylcarbamoyladenosine modification protein TsaB